MISAANKFGWSRPDQVVLEALTNSVALQSDQGLLSEEFCDCGTWGSHCVLPRSAWAGLKEARQNCV